MSAEPTTDGQASVAIMGDVNWQMFIAYPGREGASADQLYSYLERSGVRTFLDHISLDPGDLWASTILRAQRDALVTVVLVSRATAGAFYQNEEVAQAIALFREDPKRHRVVPIYLDADADPPYGLRSIQSLVVPDCGGMEGVAAALLPLVGLGGPDVERSPSEPGSVRPTPAVSRRSPFRPGMPLYASDFLPGSSRRAFLSTLNADLGGGANVNLVGERRTGRTSTLNHLHGQLIGESSRVVARVNLQDDIANDRSFYGAALWGIGQSPLGKEAIARGRILNLNQNPIAEYAELRTTLRTLRRYATVVLLVDEFERCFDSPNAFPRPSFFDNLRSLLGGDEHGPYASAVVATRQPLATYFTSHQITSTLPSYLPVRQLQLLTDADVEEALAQDSPHRLGPAQREHAASIAGCHPCRVQSAGEAWYRALDGGRDPAWVQGEYETLSQHTCFGALPHHNAVSQQ